ncbi:hypothetical protein ACWCW7_33710 [Nocardia tengchongensis]
MMAVVMTFLSGLGLGGLAVWALVSYTAMNPVSGARPEGATTVASIIARIERERLDGSGSVRAGGPVKYR